MSDPTIPENEPVLVIQARPQISVEATKFGEVQISTSFIGDDFRNVEHGDVVIPMEDVPAVIAALQGIVARGS